MRKLEDILLTRNLRFAKLSDTTKRVTGKDLLEGKEPMEPYIKQGTDFIAFGGDYYDTTNNRQLNYMFSVQGGWEHLSVSMPSRTPTWDQMCIMKEIFFEDEEEAVEYHPKKSEYINAHSHCLHIWRPRMSEIIGIYQEKGMVVPGEVIKMKDLLKDLFPDEKVREQVLKIYRAEMGNNPNLESGIQLYDKVPSDLLVSMPEPPYSRVGMKTKEGFDALKEFAKENNIQVGITGNDLQYKNANEEENNEITG